MFPLLRLDWDKTAAKAQVRVGVKSSEETLDSESDTALMDDKDATAAESNCELLVLGSQRQVVVACHRVLAFGVVVRLAHPLHHDFRNSTLYIQLHTVLVINVAPVLRLI